MPRFLIYRARIEICAKGEKDMIFKILGLILIIIGAVVCYGQRMILSKILHNDSPTDSEILRVKIFGLALAVIGAIAIFIFK